MEKKQVLLFGFGVITIFLVSFVGNVFLHEIGHYVAADHFGLNPEIKVESMGDSLNFGLESKALAYTVFDHSDSDLEMLGVSIMGPLINLVLSLILLTVYVLKKDSEIVRILVLAALVPCIFSFLMNILPFGGTDGEYILSLII